MSGSVHAHNVGISLLSAVGVEHLVAKNEDEYIRLALELASNVTALSNLRMDLRRLMSKSSLCNGSKFMIGLESGYRDIWRRYCKGEVPSLRRMEMLQKQAPQITSKDEGFVAGIRGIEWDADELPSQFMENWCYHRDTLMSIAKHYETGETLPEEIYQKLLAAKTFRAGTLSLRQLKFATVDLELHSRCLIK